MFSKFIVLVLSLSLLSCTSIKVKPVDDQLQVRHMCIQVNPKVIRDDFLPVLERGFQNHGITTEVYNGKSPEYCEFITTYTVRQTWDMAMVLADAQIWIHQDKRQVAYANYHLKGGGGFSLMKWQGAEKKIFPVMDALLEEYPSTEGM